MVPELAGALPRYNRNAIIRSEMNGHCCLKSTLAQDCSPV
jgi:hypothetical protein